MRTLVQARRVAAGLWLAAALPCAQAAELTAEPGRLHAVLSQAGDGDVIRLEDGRYAGNFVVGSAIRLLGSGQSVLDGEGTGRVLTVDAPNVHVRGLAVTGSGDDLAVEDAGIFLTQKARGAIVEDNVLTGNLIGVYLKGAAEAVVRNNRITGRTDLRVNDRGNGVHVWNAPGARVLGNDIRDGRDGIFVTTSRDNVFADNSFRGVRFAVHYMYTQDSSVSRNRSYNNDVGYALMFSRRLTVADNLPVGDRDHGLMLNYVMSSTLTGNAVVDGGTKCVFIYNANRNRFEQNWFEGCAIGVHFTAGSERNVMSRNAFVGNRHQVKYVGTRNLVWAKDGVGNYWSDDPNFDLDNDGIGDRPYRPNDMVDQVLWAHPQAKLLLKSPAVETLRYALSRLPALRPGSIVDTAPLMLPPSVPARPAGKGGS